MNKPSLAELFARPPARPEDFGPAFTEAERSDLYAALMVADEALARSNQRGRPDDRRSGAQRRRRLGQLRAKIWGAEW